MVGKNALRPVGTRDGLDTDNAASPDWNRCSVAKGFWTGRQGSQLSRGVTFSWTLEIRICQWFAIRLQCVRMLARSQVLVVELLSDLYCSMSWFSENSSGT